MENEIDRVPIWSIETEERVLHVVLSMMFFISQAGIILHYEYKNISQTVVNFAKISGPVGLSSVVLSFFLIEWVCFMLIQTDRIIEKFKKERIKMGRKLERESLQNFLNKNPNATISDYLEQIEPIYIDKR